MIAELILGAVFGLFAGMFLSWAFNKFRERKIKNPDNIIKNLQKQEKEGYSWIVDGKKIDWKKQLNVQEKLDKQIEELREEENNKPYTPADLPPLPSPPTNLNVPKEEVKKQTSSSLNKMLGRK